MPEFNPSMAKEWLSFLFSIGWKAGVVLVVIYYRDLVTKIVGGFFETIYSHIKRK